MLITAGMQIKLVTDDIVLVISIMDRWSCQAFANKERHEWKSVVNLKYQTWHLRSNLHEPSLAYLNEFSSRHTANAVHREYQDLSPKLCSFKSISGYHLQKCHREFWKLIKQPSLCSQISSSNIDEGWFRYSIHPWILKHAILSFEMQDHKNVFVHGQAQHQLMSFKLYLLASECLYCSLFFSQQFPKEDTAILFSMLSILFLSEINCKKEEMALEIWMKKCFKSRNAKLKSLKVRFR